MWASGGIDKSQPQLADDLRAFKAPQELIDQAEALARDEAVLEVWPENWETLRLFLDLGTQWSVGFGGAVGLRYESALAVMRVRGVKNKAEKRLDELRIMEAAALEALNNAR